MIVYACLMIYVSYGWCLLFVAGVVLLFILDQVAYGFVVANRWFVFIDYLSLDGGFMPLFCCFGLIHPFSTYFLDHQG